MQKYRTWSSLAVFVIFFIYFWRVNPPLINDTYFHLAVGREVLLDKKIPEKDTFVYGSVDTNYKSTEWLSGLIFYGLLESFGISGILVFRSLLGTATIVILYFTLRLVTKRYWLILISLAFVGFLLPFRLSSRPEMFSLLFLSLVNFTCWKICVTSKFFTIIYLYPLIFLLWPNLHGFAMLGFITITFWLTLFAYEALRKVISKKDFIKFLAVYLFSATVMGFQFDRVFFFAEANKFSGFITEWGSVFDKFFPKEMFKSFNTSVNIDIYLYLFIFILILGIFAHSLLNLEFKRGPIMWFFLIIMLIPFKFSRLIVPSLVLSVPAFVFYASRLNFSSVYAKWVSTFSNSILMFAIAWSIIAGKQVGSPVNPSSIVYPTSAKDFIQSNLEPRRVFTYSPWDDYFIWSLPGVKTFADVMHQYRTKENLLEEQKMHSPDESAFKLFEKYDVDVVVNTNWTNTFKSFSPIQTKVGWTLVYIDNLAAVYAREGSIKNLPINLSAINVNEDGILIFDKASEGEIIDQLNALVAFDDKNLFARRELSNYYFVRKKDLITARVFAEESREKIKGEPLFSFVLAAVALETGDCQSALPFAKEAILYGKDNELVETSAGTIIRRCSNR